MSMPSSNGISPKCPRCLAQLKTYESTVSLLRSIKEETAARASLDPEILPRSQLPQLTDRAARHATSRCSRLHLAVLHLSR